MPTSWTSPAARRRSSRHLAVTTVIAALAIAGAVAVPESTGAMYTATASSSVEGFQVQPLCDFDTYTSVPELLDELGPTAHWGFDPGAGPEGWAGAGSPLPAPAAPDGTLLCDDGVIALTTGQSVSSAAAFGSPTTAVLVLGTPSSAGVVFSLLASDGGADVVVDGTDVSVRAWADGVAPVTVTTGELDGGATHVVAVTVIGNDVTVWVDGTSSSGAIPAVITGTLGGAGLGLGTLVALDAPHDVPTAQFTATELAVVGGALSAPQLESLHAAAVPAP